jgi:hypothetical protein
MRVELTRGGDLELHEARWRVRVLFGVHHLSVTSRVLKWARITIGRNREYKAVRLQQNDETVPGESSDRSSIERRLQP